MEWTKILFHNSAEPFLFHNGFFLFIFSLFLIFYGFIFKKIRWRDLAIILFGFYFYYKCSGIFILLLVLSLSADYLFSIWMCHNNKQNQKKAILILGILFSLSFLIYFKYRNFFLENYHNIRGENYNLTHLILPIGISFYTFQSISYLVDVYQNKLKPSGYKNYLLYMTFFPHLVAGPIVRAKDFLPQIKKKTILNKAKINEALYLIIKGLIKKAIIADFIGQYADSVFSTPNGFTGGEHLVSVLCYSLQIFCDFSGYTDMAIGIALLLGFRLRINFDSPYKALNITNFWRRWHISLSSWLRDYIYIPMGGNRKGLILQLLFLLLTMLIGGFWHGANWKFVFWGAGHGLLLVFHKLIVLKFPKKTEKIPLKILFWTITFVCVCLLWVPFRAETMNDALIIYKKLFTNMDFHYFPAIFRTNTLLIVLLIFGFVATLFPNKLKDFIKMKFYETDLIFKIFFLGIVIQMFLQIKSSSVQPFIYFQF